ncbi:MAG: glucosaminidase domain-containing protein [Desulfuromonadales bacterium]|nr:glucosaminidase domain-containing protein [Desulfuromonadales bacterium]
MRNQRVNEPTSQRFLLVVSLCLLILAGGCQEPVSPATGSASPEFAVDVDILPSIAPPTTRSLHLFFDELDYSWEELDDGVPPFILERFPEDLDRQTRKRKQTFFMGLLPLVLLANQEIEAERGRFQEIMARVDQGETVDPSDSQWLQDLVSSYRLTGSPLVDHGLRRQILTRIDTIPPSLVLAQAANESAWGTSRFAREGNNLFGEWTFRKGAGIVPARRDPQANHEVRIFADLYQSVRSYLKNLNTHNAYRELREIRARLKQDGQTVSGRDLVHGLKRYSAREEEYVAEIDAMIRQNRLSRVNRTYLRQSPAETAVESSRPGAGLFASRQTLSAQTSTLREDP